jgi:hypothetical protein
VTVSLAVAAAPAPAPPPAGRTAAATATSKVVVVDATRITVAHWGRLADGELFARARYVAWAVLMKRTYGFDVLKCPSCGRKMVVLGTITEPAVVRKILEPLGVRASPLPRAPARDPDWEQVNLGL